MTCLEVAGKELCGAHPSLLRERPAFQSCFEQRNDLLLCRGPVDWPEIAVVPDLARRQARQQPWQLLDRLMPEPSGVFGVSCSHLSDEENRQLLHVSLPTDARLIPLYPLIVNIFCTHIGTLDLRVPF